MAEPDFHARELEHHEALYAGFAQDHFAKPAVRAFRRHLANRICRLASLMPSSRLLSLGCGIGDTELLLAPRAGQIVGVDLSPSAIRQARIDAERAGLRNIEFVAANHETLDFPPASFDVIIAIFFLHHLPDDELERIAALARRLLAPAGVFYSLDPSRYRLSGAIGRLLVPGLMKKYQSPDERELVPSALRAIFDRSGFDAAVRMYDYLSTPAAGLFPSSKTLYTLTRMVDEILIRTPLVRRLGSNFELVAHHKR
ncbi:MAG: class I SAM-dependent methyltransferase [Bryobacteraceae bacterium]|nr:class I SAM-dependent methyltransferase [Bryobacteraceae bacterium]